MDNYTALQLFTQKNIIDEIKKFDELGIYKINYKLRTSDYYMLKNNIASNKIDIKIAKNISKNITSTKYLPYQPLLRTIYLYFLLYYASEKYPISTSQIAEFFHLTLNMNTSDNKRSGDIKDYILDLQKINNNSSIDCLFSDFDLYIGCNKSSSIFGANTYYNENYTISDNSIYIYSIFDDVEKIMNDKNIPIYLKHIHILRYLVNPKSTFSAFT